MPSSNRSCSLSLLLLISFSRLMLGQAATGIPPFGSFGSGPFDTVNVANFNVHFGIPILSKAGRGVSFHYLMDYESSIWVPTTVGSSVVWQPTNTTKWGWAAQSEALTGTVPTVATTLGCWVTNPNTGLKTKYYYPATRYTGYKDPSGTLHAAPITTTNGYSGCDDYPTVGGAVHTGSATAADGSGYLITINELGSPRVQVQTRSGWTIPNPGTSTGTVIDTNGNELTTAVNSTTTTFTDTLGTTVLTVNVPSSSTATYSYTAPSGATAQFTFNYTQKTVQTNFGCSGVGEYPATSVYLLTSINLPDSTSYSFTYEQTPGKAAGIVTGRIASVTLPTGGEMSYTYTGGNNGIVCNDGSAAGLQRTTPDGTWTYVHSSGTWPNWNNTITDANGNQVALAVTGIYEYQRLVYQGSTSTGTLLETVTSAYNGHSVGASVTLPITRRTVTVELPSSTGLQSKTDVFLNSLGLPTEVDQYGYGSGASGALVRKTLTTYNSSLTNNILDRPASITVQDGSANVIGKTTFGYDETSVLQNSGTPPQHISITGSRGNLTTVSSFYSNSGSTNKTYSYYDTGTVNVATDVNGATTTYNYGTGSCGYSFPDGVSLPLSLSRSTAYNCTGGVATAFTDENGNVSYTNYATDQYFWRPNSVQDTTGVLTTIAYTGATQAESTLTFNGGNSTVDVLSTLDSLGRPLYTQKKQSPTSTNYDSAQRIYDATDALFKTTVPYTGTAGQSSLQGTPAVTTNYDTLGRSITITDGGGGAVTLTYTKNDVLQVLSPAPSGENTKQKQLEYDPLGRLTSVCEITTGSTTGACGQSVSQNGFLTTYAYDTTTVNSVLVNRTTVTQNAQPNGGTAQTRTFLYDLLGRLVQETNPESGTTSYVYDSDSGGPCASGTYLPGNLAMRTDAVGNVTCYSYDQFHRVLSVSYPSGSYSASTSEKYFVYDSATVSGSTMANAKGRLAEAYTCTGSCTSKTTDLGFSYTQRGEIKDVYESTSHSSGYYHLTATYFPHGALNGLSGVPGLPTIYYGGNNDTSGLDGEGRYLKVTASTGTNPMTSVSYTNSGTTQPIGSLSGVTFGSADGDAFTYDVNTGRMTQFQNNIGTTQSVTSSLTWNANGSLSTLAVTDQVVTANSETCNYTHDDLSRIASANCGTAWSQTFGPDAFGNITKSGTGSFLPTYNLATNRFQSIPGGTPTYDSNGNLTYDLSHNYSWDADGKVLAIDTVNLTYDALGRMVEQARGSSFTEIVYSPTGGKLALMNSQTLQKAFVGLPGGATAVYTSSGLAYYRHADWLGSSRLATTPSRTKYYDVAYAPYGESYLGSGTTDVNFTGQNQDTISGLYDFLYREYHPAQGRWISPDPAGLAAANAASPQTWNRYAYAGNNPLVYTDPFGLDGIKPYVPANDPATFNNWVWEVATNSISVQVIAGWDVIWAEGQSQELPSYEWITLYPDFNILGIGAWDPNHPDTGNDTAANNLCDSNGNCVRGPTPKELLWPDADLSTCSTYPSGGPLNYVCTIAGDNRWANSARGCLQTYWDPSTQTYSMNQSGPGEPGAKSAVSFVTSHAVCLTGALFY